MLRVIAVDDEPAALADICNRIRADPRLTLVGSARSTIEASALIETKKPEALFLDVQMLGADGLELAKRYKQLKVIFISAHARYAIDAFEVEAVDYILKPVNRARFSRAVERLTQIFSLEKLAIKDKTSNLEEARLTVSVGREKHIIFAKDVVLLKAEGDCTRLFLTGDRSILSGYSLKSLESRLPKPQFVRLGRSVMLNLPRIRGIHSNARVKLSISLAGLKDPLILGRSAAALLRQHLDQ